MRRSCTHRPLAAASFAVAVLLALAACGGGGAETTSATGVGGAAAPARLQAEDVCTEEALRAALLASGQVDLEYEVTHLECAEGFGWALIDPVLANFDVGTVLLRVTDSGLEILDIGTSSCPADHGIPPDVAGQIAPPGVDPAGDCPEPAPTDPEPAPTAPGPGPAEPGHPLPGEADFTG